jgi:hypothetical protein
MRLLLLPAAAWPVPPGITAFALGCGFVVAMFFAPIFSSIPGFATGPALVVVGTMMIGHAREIDVSVVVTPWHSNGSNKAAAGACVALVPHKVCRAGQHWVVTMLFPGACWCARLGPAEHTLQEACCYQTNLLPKLLHSILLLLLLLLQWDNLKVAFPSFLTIVLMPLTYSIAYGVLTGILANITVR